MRHGTSYTNAWAGILESETPSGHTAIATGSTPRENGILSFGWANGDNVPVDLFDPAKIDNHDLERIIAASRVPTIAGLVHRANPKARVVALSGHKYYAADAIGGPDADVIMYYQSTRDGKYAPTAVPGHLPPRSLLTDPRVIAPSARLKTGGENHLVMDLAMRSFETMHQQVTLINLPEFDWPLGHVWGADRDRSAVVKMMQEFDVDLGRMEEVYRKAGVLDQTLFVITADHGFAPIDHTVSQQVLEKAVAAAGTSIISDTYHTAAYIWVKNESRSVRAAANIAKLQNPYIQSVYFKESVAGRYDFVRASGPELFHAPGVEAANQYLLHTFSGPNAPDLAVFFTEDTASLPGGEATWKGDHGGADWESQHLPLVFSGPGVRSGHVSTDPARLEDIAPTVLTLMGIQPRGMGGIPLADALARAPAGAVAGERAQAGSQLPVITALQREAQAEVAAGQ
jgi:hypothetical protein